MRLMGPRNTVINFWLLFSGLANFHIWAQSLVSLGPPLPQSYGHRMIAPSYFDCSHVQGCDLAQQEEVNRN